MIYVEVGPACIAVSGHRDGQAFEFDRAKLEEWVGDLLRDVREFLPLLRQKAYRIKKTGLLPEVARRMVEAVKIVDEETLTPMAAVAGAVADLVRERCEPEALDFITVNNGGDISIGNRWGRLFRAGLGNIGQGRETPYVLGITGLTECGIASSGFGGRSLTLGLADMVTVVAKTGAVADAAATFICNNTDSETEHVVRKKAYDLDPLTDIPDELVTVSIGTLNKGVIAKALETGLGVACNLKKLNIINDAVLVLRDHVVTTINGEKNIRLEVQNGD